MLEEQHLDAKIVFRLSYHISKLVDVEFFGLFHCNSKIAAQLHLNLGHKTCQPFLDAFRHWNLWNRLNFAKRKSPLRTAADGVSTAPKPEEYFCSFRFFSDATPSNSEATAERRLWPLLPIVFRCKTTTFLNKYLRQGVIKDDEWAWVKSVRRSLSQTK